MARRTRLWPNPKVVVIGGGTGTSTILHGFKKHTDDLTAIISVMDDGGSTGRLRKDMDLIAVGDIRSCLLALSNAEEETSRLLNHRFEYGELAGHSFGNLFLVAMNCIYDDINKAIAQTSKMLNITGSVLPITLQYADLTAELSDGSFIRGESMIAEKNHELGTRIIKMGIDPFEITMLDEAKKAISEADIIVLGPGSLYTSIIPNLLAKDMVDLLQESRAKVVYVSNIMGQYGETEGYSVKEHYDAIIDHTRKGVIDYVIANDGIIDPKLLERYRNVFSSQVDFSQEDKIYLESQGVKVIHSHLVRVKNQVIRHDADKLSEIIFREILLGD